jgi:hypothetical protein
MAVYAVPPVKLAHPAGHEFFPENSLLRRKGARTCHEIHRAGGFPVTDRFSHSQQENCVFEKGVRDGKERVNMPFEPDKVLKGDKRVPALHAVDETAFDTALFG